jgi:hypothetical protein
VPVIITKITIMERALIITAKIVLVITTKIIIIERALIITMERILVALEHKKGNKDGYYRLH